MRFRNVPDGLAIRCGRSAYTPAQAPEALAPGLPNYEPMGPSERVVAYLSATAGLARKIEPSGSTRWRG